MEKWRVWMRAGHRAQVLALALLGVLSSACSDVKQEAILALQPGSQVTLAATGLPALMSTQQGFIRSTITLSVDIGDFLRGRPIQGTVAVNEINIAGTPLEIAPGLTSGTLCTSLDKTQKASGTATIDLRRERLMLTVQSGTQISVTDANLRQVLAAAADLKIPVSIQATVPINLFDLIGALLGQALPIQITQPIMQTLPADLPLLGGATLSGRLVLAAATQAPTSARIQECKAFAAMP